MSKVFLLLTLSCFFSFNVSADSSVTSDATNLQIQKIEKLLINAKEQDQQVRRKLIENGLSKVNDELRTRITVVDNQNTGALKSILSIFGWDCIFRLNEDAKDAAFLVIQHSDEDIVFQEFALGKLNEFFKKGLVDGQDLAILTDKVLISRGEKQVYGTQFDFVDGELKISPIDNAKETNERRSKLGLPSIEKYKEILVEFYSKN